MLMTPKSYKVFSGQWILASEYEYRIETDTTYELKKAKNSELGK